jgi:hypothetical protein
MNLILEKTDQIKYFTNMNEVFSALNIRCKDYDWYVSDIETNGVPIREGWHTGSELESTIQNNDIQFIWAVFSAFSAGKRVEVNDAPYIYDNPECWNSSNVGPQINEALFEIGCWDSSATILVGITPEMGSNFKSVYSDTTELENAAR